MKAKEVIAELIKNDKIDVLYQSKRSNQLYQRAEQDITQNTLFRLLPPAQNIAGEMVTYAATEPTGFVANGSDEDAPSRPIEKGGFKMGSTSSVYFAENCFMTASDMALYGQYLNSCGTLKQSLAARIAPTFSNSFEELAKRLMRRKALMVRDAFRGTIVVPIIGANGTPTDLTFDTGIAQIDKSVSAPWTNPATDIPSQFEEVLDATPFAPVDTAIMNKATGNVLRNHPSVQDKLCCETMEATLRSEDTAVIGTINGIRLWTLGRAENQYQLPDKTWAKFMEDGEVFFVRTADGGIFGHYNFWNFNQECDESCETGLNPVFGTQMTVGRKSDPAKIKFALTAKTNIDVQTPGGAIHFLAY